MQGTSASDGKLLDGLAHLRQSITDILTTPLGTRVQRRDYGSRLYQLVDAPMNAETIVDLYAATAEALANWEPRFRLTQVKLSSADAGAIELDLVGQYLPDGQTVTLDGIKVK